MEIFEGADDNVYTGKLIIYDELFEDGHPTKEELTEIYFAVYDSLFNKTYSDFLEKLIEIAPEGKDG